MGVTQRVHQCRSPPSPESSTGPRKSPDLGLRDPRRLRSVGSFAPTGPTEPTFRVRTDLRVRHFVRFLSRRKIQMSRGPRSGSTLRSPGSGIKGSDRTRDRLRKSVCLCFRHPDLGQRERRACVRMCVCLCVRLCVRTCLSA